MPLFLGREFFLLNFSGLNRTFIQKTLHVSYSFKVLHLSNYAIIKIEKDYSLQEYSIIIR